MARFVSFVTCPMFCLVGSKRADRTRTEGAELYRTLGVSPDADYMDVVAACDRLKEKYKGDRKKVRVPARHFHRLPNPPCNLSLWCNAHVGTVAKPEGSTVWCDCEDLQTNLRTRVRVQTVGSNDSCM